MCFCSGIAVSPPCDHQPADGSARGRRGRWRAARVVTDTTSDILEVSGIITDPRQDGQGQFPAFFDSPPIFRHSWRSFFSGTRPTADLREAQGRNVDKTATYVKSNRRKIRRRGATGFARNAARTGLAPQTTPSGPAASARQGSVSTLRAASNSCWLGRPAPAQDRRR